MTLQFTTKARRLHRSRDNAERAIEVYYLPGNSALNYEIIEMRIGGATDPRKFAVKAYSVEGRFLGYCYDPDEAESYLDRNPTPPEMEQSR